MCSCSELFLYCLWSTRVTQMKRQIGMSSSTTLSLLYFSLILMGDCSLYSGRGGIVTQCIRNLNKNITLPAAIMWLFSHKQRTSTSRTGDVFPSAESQRKWATWTEGHLLCVVVTISRFDMCSLFLFLSSCSSLHVFFLLARSLGVFF